jgi:hypothetical protein
VFCAELFSIARCAANLTGPGTVGGLFIAYILSLEFRGHPPVCRATACTTSRESEQSVEWISTIMKTIRFVVKTNRQGTRGPEYVQRIDRTPIQTTSNRRLALLMGRFTAEDVVNSIRTSRCSPELISVET